MRRANLGEQNPTCLNRVKILNAELTDSFTEEARQTHATKVL